MKKGLKEFIEEEDADIFCFQETKLQDGVEPMIKGYHCYWHASTAKKGYSGTAIVSKEKPIHVSKKINNKDNKFGRILTAEYEHFYLVNTYVPNSGRKLENLKKRVEEWDKDIKEHIKTLQQKKKVIWCGDLNVSMRWIDLGNPSGRVRIAGFTKEERESFYNIVEELDLVDSFQVKYPKVRNLYTFYSYFDKARTNGWRLDYFIVSKELSENITEIYRRKYMTASDHVPLVLHLQF